MDSEYPPLGVCQECHCRYSGTNVKNPFTAMCQSCTEKILGNYCPICGTFECENECEHIKENLPYVQ